MNRASWSCFLLKRKSLEELKQIHAQGVIQGFLHFQPASCKILNAYASFGRIAEAEMVINQIQDPDVVSLTSLMSLYLQINDPNKAFSVFLDIVSAGYRADSFAMVGAISACGRKENLGHGKTVHGMIYRLELVDDVFVNNALIDMYSRNGRLRTAQTVFNSMGVKNVVSWTSMVHGHIKCRNLESAYHVFTEMPVRNAISWTTMITGYIQCEDPIRALQLFQRMRLAGEMPTVVTLVGVLSGCADIGALDLGQSIHGYICKTNTDSDLTVLNSVIDMYSKSGSVETAEKVFKSMAERDVYTWTTVISCFASHGNGSRALQLFSEMLAAGIKPNEITFLAVLSACSHTGLIEEGRRWFDRMRGFHDLEPKLEHYGCMVDLLGRAGHLDEALRLIEAMRVDPDGVIWRSLMSACLVQGNMELAVEAGKKIIELEPDDDGVYVLLWNMFASGKRWKEAQKVRRLMIKRRVKKKPGYSWIEVNGIAHQFLVEDKTHHLYKEIYSVLEGLSKQLLPDFI
ncbi:pentatricopeptide repeat-containing protein At2g13600-like [Aristolochia californica]|uniref:pentatricopeptide repeat-containing protein At2g13600-like n=1 Tax=Aristolochia californica TaxID=171875 RepID=UPI0035DE0DA6